MTNHDHIPTKACPVLLRFVAGETEILAFRHPLEGCQLVKGTIESGEAHELAALRELNEESGIASATVSRHLGTLDSGYKEQIWTFYLCEVGAVDNGWTHRTQDDGGQDFQFFWHPIHTEPDDEWHPVYRRAIKWLQDRI